jgi:hypothetical protein
VPSLDKRLQEILDQLPEAQVQQLLEYAQFLLARHGAKNPNVEPLVIPRPAEESVVKAIQRLRETYPMLDPAKLLNETAALMMQHVMQGRDASVVIDELEVLFQRHYRKVKPGS